MSKLKGNGALLGSVLIITAGIFWGSMGIFVRALTEYGFNSIQIVALRLTVAAVAFTLLSVAIGGRNGRIAARDIPLFLGLGLGSILFFTVCYFTAISMMTLSMAAILLYTSPIWVMLMSCIFFKERLSAKKLAALACAFGGCMLVCGIGGGNISAAGLAIGLCSGLGYGLYSILGSVALRKYTPLTVTAGTFVVAALGAWCVCAPGELLGIVADCGDVGALLLLVLVTGFITAVIPFAAYTVGLKYTEPGRAAILATVEPMVATLLGAVVFGESITLLSALGVLLILAAVVLLNMRSRRV